MLDAAASCPLVLRPVSGLPDPAWRNGPFRVRVEGHPGQQARTVLGSPLLDEGAPLSLPDPEDSRTGRPHESGSGRRSVVAVNVAVHPPGRRGQAGASARRAPARAAGLPVRLPSDVVDAASAVVTVAVALLRHAVDTAAQGPRRVAPHLRSAAPPSLRGALPGRVARALSHPVSAAVRVLGAAADELVPGATRAVLARLDVPALVREYVDLDRLAALLDVDAVVARVDLDAVLDRIDVDAVAARLDLDAVAARLDLDRLVDKVDVARVVDRVDLDAVAAGLDLDALVARVDVTRVIDRVDLDAVVDRVDLDRAVERVDIDQVIARTDVAGIARYVVREIDLPGLLRMSTGTVTSDMVRGVRDQGADADRAVERVVDRLLRRPGRRTATNGSDPGRGSDDHR